MASPPIKRVIDFDGRKWEVSAVIEGLGWDAELPIRRENWLRFETKGERRYVAPLPDDWASWSEDELREALVAAPLDKRGSPPV